MKSLIFSIVLVMCWIDAHSQLELFSLSYGKSYVTKDSSTYNLTIHVNTSPGTQNSPGNYNFFNVNLTPTSRWRGYLKPSTDINLGTTTASAPNNVSVALSGGLIYDLPPRPSGPRSIILEISPEMISDKSFKNSLRYLSFGPHFQYNTTYRNGLEINFYAGANFAFGSRVQNESKFSNYSRLSIPVILSFQSWNASYTRLGATQQYKRLKLAGTYRFNSIFNDDQSVTTQNHYNYVTTKLSFYPWHNIAVFFSYANGATEPLFKPIDTWSVGFTVVP